MKKRFWIPGLSLLALGSVFYFFVMGYSFSGCLLWGLGGLCLLFGLLDSLRKKWPRLMKTLSVVLGILTGAAAAACVVTGGFIAASMDGAPEPEADYVIFLGAGVNGTEPSLSLYNRLTAGEAYLRAHPEAVAVLSGGMGGGENITEAECMYRWLTARGMDPERLLLEDRASSTEENIRFSLALLEEKTGSRPTEAAVVSSEYHLYRAELIGRREGLEVLGVPAETTLKPLLVNMFLREIFAVWAQWLGL